MTSPAPAFPSTGGSVRLHDWGLIRAAGDDARNFLHGQLTQDMLDIGPQGARLAGYCSAKGRLLASFIVWQRSPTELLLACSADLLPAVLKKLSMFVLRAKCKLSDATAELPLFGLAGEAAARALGNDAPAAAWSRSVHGNADIVRLPDAAGMPRFLWAAAEAPPLPPLAGELWRWLEVQSAVPRIVAATAERFVPQMVNLELVGGVNFQKGCYPGQEVVARSQYRGTLKRRACLFDSSGEAVVGQELFSADDPEQPAGVVAGAAPVPGGAGRYSVLAEVRLAALHGSALHLGRVDGPALAAAALPYALPAEA